MYDLNDKVVLLSWLKFIDLVIPERIQIGNNGDLYRRRSIN